MGELILKLNKYQRADMVQNGWNPLDDEQVQSYLNGEKKDSSKIVNESIARMGGKNILKKPAMPSGVGSSESEVNAYGLLGQEAPTTKTGTTRSATTDVREAIKNDMADYSSFSTRQAPEKKMDRVTEQFAVEYFNSLKIIFTKQNAEFADWLESYKYLKRMLEDIHKSSNKGEKMFALEDVKRDFVNNM